MIGWPAGSPGRGSSDGSGCARAAGRSRNEREAAFQARPRSWVSLDIDYLTRPRIVELRQTFGAKGPLVLLAIILEADKTDLGRTTDTVEARYGPIGEMVGTTADRARQIIEKAAELKLVSIEQHHDPATGREFERLRLLERHRVGAASTCSLAAGRTPVRGASRPMTA